MIRNKWAEQIRFYQLMIMINSFDKKILKISCIIFQYSKKYRFSCPVNLCNKEINVWRKNNKNYNPQYKDLVYEEFLTHENENRSCIIIPELMIEPQRDSTRRSQIHVAIDMRTESERGRKYKEFDEKNFLREKNYRTKHSGYFSRKKT